VQFRSNSSVVNYDNNENIVRLKSRASIFSQHIFTDEDTILNRIGRWIAYVVV
jgi:hypothetical protein